MRPWKTLLDWRAWLATVPVIVVSLALHAAEPKVHWGMFLLFTAVTGIITALAIEALNRKKPPPPENLPGSSPSP